MKFLVSKLIFIALILVLVSCSKENSHPNFEQLPQANEVDFLLNLNQDSDKTTYELLDLQKGKNYKSVSKDNLDLDLFGIRNLLVDPMGNIYFTQTENLSIYVYDKNGNYKYSIGRSGNGPGEFENISTFAFNKSYDKLFVLDNSEIEVYLYDRGYFIYNYTISPKIYRMKDLCVLNNTLYLSGFKYEELDTLSNSDKPYNSSKLISGPINGYDISKDKTIVDFGSVYNSYSGWWVLDTQLSSMKLICNEKSNTIVGILENFGYLYGYKPDGELKWVSKLEDFKYATLIERNINTPQLSYSASAGAKFSTSRLTNSNYSVIHLLNKNKYPVELIINTQNGELIHGGLIDSVMFGAFNGSMSVDIKIDWDDVNSASELLLYNATRSK